VAGDEFATRFVKSLEIININKTSMKAVDIIMVPVKDRQAAKEFYVKLGFKVLVEAPDPHGEPWIQLGLPNSNTSISLASFQGIICETDNIESELKTLKAKGIEVGKIDDTPWGKFAWLKDLDGNSLCLHEKPAARQ
jgi:catechol 2,3-dioxygenase-like lactoylglutathione lyase family enzyme